MRTARSRHVTPEPMETTVGYKNQLIETVEHEGFYITYATINGNRRRARNIDHAKHLIDDYTDSLKEPELHDGGWIKYPPVYCNYTRINQDGLWAEAVICSFICMHENCPSFILLQKRRNKRPEKEVTTNVVSEVVVETDVKPVVSHIHRRRR